MKERHIRHLPVVENDRKKIAGLPVVDEKASVIGIVTESDLLRTLATKLREAEEVTGK